MIGAAHASDLSGAAPVPDGMTQLNATAVGNAHQPGLSPEASRPVLLRMQAPKPAGAFRQLEEQVAVVVPEPGIASAPAGTLDAVLEATDRNGQTVYGAVVIGYASGQRNAGIIIRTAARLARLTGRPARPAAAVLAAVQGWREYTAIGRESRCARSPAGIQSPVSSQQAAGRGDYGC